MKNKWLLFGLLLSFQMSTAQSYFQQKNTYIGVDLGVQYSELKKLNNYTRFFSKVIGFPNHDYQIHYFVGGSLSAGLPVKFIPGSLRVEVAYNEASTDESSGVTFKVGSWRSRLGWEQSLLKYKDLGVNAAIGLQYQTGALRRIDTYRSFFTDSLVREVSIWQSASPGIWLNSTIEWSQNDYLTFSLTIGYQSAIVKDIKDRRKNPVVLTNLPNSGGNVDLDMSGIGVQLGIRYYFLSEDSS